MAPSPEYDKEPKAPDKSAPHISSEDTKLLHNLVNDQHCSSDHKTTNSATSSEIENKHVETLDDEKLRALLDEAITYKCPKDREGKSSLFKELLEEVEQDEQACEAAARNLTGWGGGRRGARGRRPLPHSNSLQDLVAALAAEPAPRHTRHHARHHAPNVANVSARAIHGGSLPSGVDTSSLLSEEGVGVGVGVGAGGYLATVRCVNPPPLAERRVSASDANAPHELELLNRRSKPTFPMTYTARATLEIGSGSVGSGRAVTTTTASNQMSNSGAGSGCGVELEEIVCHRANRDNAAAGSFSEYLAGQEQLLRAMHASDQDEYSPGARPAARERDVSSDAEERAPPPPQPALDKYVLAELPNNAYIFLTLPKRLLNKHRESHESNRKPIDKKRKKDKVPVGTSSSKRTDAINRNALRVLLFENLLKSDREMARGAADHEVDSAIPFSCITTPEVVTSCNTTSSSSTAVAIDPKPLQLSPSYRALSGLRGSSPPAAEAAPAPPHDAPDLQPRSVIASSFNGLPLSRPNYGSTASSNDEYKKSLDENGNSVQGFSSPLSGSSQHKKPRRKKSSKNETVIDCQQLDGYRGDKADVNELLRFIESNPETRGPKMRAKHKDDTDDKATKKRSSERRKDKEKVKRASSLEELSRTKLEDLTARATPAPKPERRSWGDATPSPATAPAPSAPAPLPTPAPESEPKQPATPEPEIYESIELPAFDLPLPLPDPVVEQADFQTVTKKRKPRRRTEEAPRRARQPSPRRQESAPPSDRSNDSNDDMDSVHSLPQPSAAPLPAPHASYADIAKTRHNIPDLIESCNYYAEGDAVEAAPPPEADYPALETRTADAPAAARRRGEARAPAAARRERKERGAPGLLPAIPAPDVVADRRPPVVLLDSASRPRDMDGVTFGFDINEQLLGGSRRPRCDLVRDTVPVSGESGGADEGAGGAVCVRAACRALRYVPPAAPPPHQLHLIVDYVGTAWDDVIRCGGGKVRYYSE